MSPRELECIALRQAAMRARLDGDTALADRLDAKADDVFPGARWIRMKGWGE